MAITQTITTIPTAGHRGVDSRDTFVTKQEAFQDALTDTTVTQLNTFATQANELEANVNTKEATVVAKEALVSPHYVAIDTVSNNITIINTVVDNIIDIQNAEENANLAQQYAQSAQLSAQNAEQTANVVKWVSGTMYAEGDNVWSTIDFQTYRAKSNTSGTTDPSLDATNWEKLGIGAYSILDITSSATSILSSDGNYKNSVAKALTLLDKNKNLIFANNGISFHDVTLGENNVVGTSFPTSDLSNTTANYTNSASKDLINGYTETSQIALYYQNVSYGKGLLEKIDEDRILSINFRDALALSNAVVYKIITDSPFIEKKSSIEVLEASSDVISTASYLNKVSDGVFLLVSNYQSTTTSLYNVRAQLIFVDGSNTITKSSIYNIGVESANSGAIYGVTKLDSTRYAIKYTEGAVAKSYFKLCVVKVESNNTLTVGTAWQSSTTFARKDYSSSGITNINGTNCYIASYGVDETTDYQRVYTFNITDTTVTMLQDAGSSRQYSSHGCSFFNIPNSNYVLEARSMSSYNYGVILTIDTLTGVISGGTQTALSSHYISYQGMITKQPLLAYEDTGYFYVAVHQSLAFKVNKSNYGITLGSILTDILIAKTATENIFYTNTTSGTKLSYLVYGNAMSNYNMALTPSFYSTRSKNDTDIRTIRSVLNGKFFVAIKQESNRPTIELLAQTKDLNLVGEYYE